MSTAKFCIHHKVTTLLAVIMISVFGVMYFCTALYRLYDKMRGEEIGVGAK